MRYLKCFSTLILTAGVVLSCRVAAAGNLPTWGGSAVNTAPGVVQPEKPIASDSSGDIVRTIQPAQPRPWRPSGPALTPATRTPVLRPQVQQTSPAAVPQWSRWCDLAWDATKMAVNSGWILQATLRNVTINGPMANGPPGCLQGPDLGPLIRSRLLSGEVPAEVADIFASSVGGAWKAWQSGVTIPGLAWYPAFASFPGPQAPPTPSVSMPLLALPSAGQAELTSAERLEARILDQFSGDQIPVDAREEIGDFSRTAARNFLIWLTAARVQGVMGQGPVPTFNPPYVPTGPVVNGSVIPTPGIISGALP